MTRRRYGYSSARVPHWWPEGETWPPFDPRRHWRRRRRGFIGRIWFWMFALWWLSGIGAFSIFTRVTGGSSGFWTGDRLWGVGVALVVGIFAVTFVAVVTRIISPIGDIVGAAARVADGDLSARVPPKGPPAVRAVAEAFNNMAGRLALQEKQRRDLMADVAHELRTPLSVVQGRLEGLIDGVYPTDASALEPLLEETRVLARIVDDLRTLANAESGVLTLEREPTDIGMLLRDAAATVRDAAGQEPRVNDDAGMPPVSVDPVRIRQIVVNLLANAVRHGGEGASVTAAASIADGALVIRVADTGPGIPADELPHIFDRFYKRKGSTGSGLGLTIARTLARAHGGDIAVDSRPGLGTTFTITIPVRVPS